LAKTGFVVIGPTVLPATAATPENFQAPRSLDDFQAPRGDRLDEIQAPRGDRLDEIQTPRGDGLAVSVRRTMKREHISSAMARDAAIEHSSAPARRSASRAYAVPSKPFILFLAAPQVDPGDCLRFRLL
jgi:hypothetical protein